MNKELETSLMVCQMHCANVAYAGAGIDLDDFIVQCDLNSEECLQLAIDESIPDFVIEAIKRSI